MKFLAVALGLMLASAASAVRISRVSHKQPPDTESARQAYEKKVLAQYDANGDGVTTQEELEVAALKAREAANANTDHPEDISSGEDLISSDNDDKVSSGSAGRDGTGEDTVKAAEKDTAKAAEEDTVKAAEEDTEEAAEDHPAEGAVEAEDDTEAAPAEGHRHLAKSQRAHELDSYQLQRIR